jgi:hypothetical protein
MSPLDFPFVIQRLMLVLAVGSVCCTRAGDVGNVRYSAEFAPLL